MAQRTANSVSQADYEAVMKAIGISTNGFKRRINKARNLARTIVASNGTNKQAVEAFEDCMRRMESELDAPDLTKHRMAKRQNSRESQQEVLERKLADAIDCIARQVPPMEWPASIARAIDRKLAALERGDDGS